MIPTKYMIPVLMHDTKHIIWCSNSMINSNIQYTIKLVNIRNTKSNTLKHKQCTETNILVNHKTKHKAYQDMNKYLIPKQHVILE